MNIKIIRSFVVGFHDIVSVEVEYGIVTNFTMRSTGLWREFDYTNCAKAHFSQIVKLEKGWCAVHHVATAKFDGLSVYDAAAKNHGCCCRLVAIHVLANGTRLIQGIEWQEKTGEPVASNFRDTRLLMEMKSDHEEGEFVKISIKGIQLRVAQTASLSDKQIMAI